MHPVSILEVLSSAAALVVAAVLLCASVSKFVRPAATARSFRDLGLRAPSLSGRLVPATELSIGLCCLVRPRLGAWLAFALLVAFTAILVPVVRSGRTVNCGCFGGTGAAPVTGTTLVRNGGLMVGALIATESSGLAGGLPTALVASGAVASAAMVLTLLDVRQTAGRLF